MAVDCYFSERTEKIGSLLQDDGGDDDYFHSKNLQYSVLGSPSSKSKANSSDLVWKFQNRLPRTLIFDVLVISSKFIFIIKTRKLFSIQMIHFSMTLEV